MIVIGIDPGVAKLGYAFIETKKKGGKLKTIDYGYIITSPDLSTGDRLKKINNELNKLIREYKPDVLAVENLYFFKNLKTAMPVSQAKGVVLLTAAKKKIPVYEFAPLEVKMTITGYGRAEKKQVQGMIKVLLDLEKNPKFINKKMTDDAADALGIALCYIIKANRKIKLS